MNRDGCTCGTSEGEADGVAVGINEGNVDCSIEGEPDGGTDDVDDKKVSYKYAPPVPLFNNQSEIAIADPSADMSIDHPKPPPSSPINVSSTIS